MDPSFQGKIQVITIITGVKSPYILGPVAQEEFVKKQETYTDKDFDILLQELEANNIELKPIIVRKLIKNEQEKLEMPSLIDLEYDLQLRHAVNIFKSNNIVLKAKAS